MSGNALPETEVARIESTMAEWLSHPLEFGLEPKRVKYLNSVQTKIAGMPEPISVHVVEYEMPDGTYGKGFVNPVTWSFAGSLRYDGLSEVQLVTAYSGWLWIFSALSDDRAKSEFKPKSINALLAELAQEGITNISVTAKYKVRTSEFFEFVGQRLGKKVRGAGSAGSKIIFDDSAPQASLPVVYTYLGMVMRGEI